MTTPISTSAERDVDAAEARHGPLSQIAVCGACDWVSRVPPRVPGQHAECPRCGHQLTSTGQKSHQPALAWAIATLVVLGLVFAFPFLGFSSHGIARSMDLLDTARQLGTAGYGAVAALLLATIAVLPGVYLLGVIALCIAAEWAYAFPGSVALARLLQPIEPWLMADVFIIGVLVSLIKIVSLARIEIDASFVAFCAYALMLLHTLAIIDWTSLWDRLSPTPGAPPRTRVGVSANAQNLAHCKICQTVFAPVDDPCCPRCGRRHHPPRIDRLQTTMALLVTAAVLYIPANLYPVLYFDRFGARQPQTIAVGVQHLVAHGDWPIALVIFLASIVVPIAKILALSWLCIAAAFLQPNARVSRLRVRLFRITEKIGRWSMIDVFVVSILTALVQSGGLLSIKPGIGVIAFASVVVLTMIAAHTFDTRLLWRDQPPQRDAVRHD